MVHRAEALKKLDESSTELKLFFGVYAFCIEKTKVTQNYMAIGGVRFRH